jgi:peptide/nickel transport system substrate-binding protein
LFPKNLGYPPEWGPADSVGTLPAIEALNEWDSQGRDTPVLAESWDQDPVNKTLTFHLRKGVKFSDGTDFNAEAVKWNFQLGIDTSTLTNAKAVVSMDVLDTYTLRINLNTYSRFMPMDFGWSKMISPTAFQKNGKEWARTHAVGTGPFIISDFVSDTSMTFTKNPNYYRQGMPYLDAIEVRYIPNAMTCSATMQAKQADIWMNCEDVQSMNTLEKAGLSLNKTPGYTWVVLPNGTDPSKPFSKIEVREALEYAINRPVLAQMIGAGQYEALTQIIPANTPGHNNNYDPRPYNPDKAKQLLAQAGYPTGFTTTLLVGQGSENAAASIKGYLDAVGIQTTVDIADMGRYFGAVFGNGWSELVFAANGGGSNISVLFDHYGPTPKTFRSGNIYKSAEYLALCNQVFTTYDDAQAQKLAEQAVKKASEDAMFVPIYRSALDAIVQPWVHTNSHKNCVSVVWDSYSDWMEKH